MDNIQLDNYPIKTMSNDLMAYYIIRGLDEKADAYMHNAMTLRQLGNKHSFFQESVCRLVQKDYSTYFTDESTQTLTSMQSPEPFNGEYLTQYIKR